MSHALLEELTQRLRALGEALLRDLTDPLGALTVEPDAGSPLLQDRLLGPLSPLPEDNAVLTLLRQITGDLPDGGPLRWHGWEREPGASRGLALLLTDVQAGGTQQAVVALSPGPVVDVVVTGGAFLNHTLPAEETAGWRVDVTASAQADWVATWRGDVPSPDLPAALGSLSVGLTRGAGAIDVPGLGPSGPGVSWAGLRAAVGITPGQPLRTELHLDGFDARILPSEIADLLGQARSAATELELVADRLAGLRFGNGSLTLPIPGGLSLPGVEARDLAVELAADAAGLHLRPHVSLRAALPALPLELDLAGLGLTVPLDLDAGRVGVDPSKLVPALPEGIEVDLDLPPASGGGSLQRLRGADGEQYAGLIDVDLGAVRVQAMGLLALPQTDARGNRRPLSFLVLLTAAFPPPGIQLGFGFALDAVGGLVGINRRVDDEQVRALVSDGNADRIMFPDDPLGRSREILDSLAACFPVRTGQHVVGPMLQLNWGGRMVRASVALLLELPDPVRVVVLGRVEIGIPDPVLPIVRLRASLYGRIEPGVPLVEILVSLAGSDVAGIPVSGDLYALFRGGADPALVLSAGGFHPRYVRPAGVPELRRVTLDVGGPVFGLRAEAYLALTSNSLQFGGLLHLDEEIAGCGVEGQLGLDALVVWEPRVAFSVQVSASVAVLAFGERLASVSLRFTLEGPGAWHAFGTGSISILWWDVDLDFDVRWGSAPALTSGPVDVVDAVRKAVADPKAWALAPPTTSRAPVRPASWAERDVAEGRLALPESGLRIAQEAVPLDVAFDRFGRRAVPGQRWRLDSVALNPGRPGTFLEEIRARFVPGEYWAMNDDEQLSRPAFEDHLCGQQLSVSTLQGDETCAADERYETDYQVDDDWFPVERHWPFCFGSLWVEWYSRRLLAPERIAVWQGAQHGLAIGPVPVRMAVTP